jgi:hypothetical protein
MLSDDTLAVTTGVARSFLGSWAIAMTERPQTNNRENAIVTRFINPPFDVSPAEGEDSRPGWARDTHATQKSKCEG